MSMSTTTIDVAKEPDFEVGEANIEVEETNVEVEETNVEVEETNAVAVAASGIGFEAVAVAVAVAASGIGFEAVAVAETSVTNPISGAFFNDATLLNRVGFQTAFVPKTFIVNTFPSVPTTKAVNGTVVDAGA